MSFEEVVDYLRHAVSHRIDVHAWPNRVGEIGVHLSGVVTRVVELPRPGREPSYFCQVGDEDGNGFRLSPDAFIRAGIDLADPFRLGLFIVLEGDYQLVIEDDRIELTSGDAPATLPT